MKLPSVSLIIPARNEATILEAKIQNALSLEYPKDRLQIIVGNDGSDDKTAEIAIAYRDRGVELVDSKSWRGKASVVNDAVQAAIGDVLCICDANVLFEQHALSNLVSRLQDDRVGAVSGDVRLNSAESEFSGGEAFYYRLERFLQRGDSRVGSMMGVDGGMYVIRKRLFQPLRPDTILDDFTISMQVIRQGYRVVHESSAVAWENGTPTAMQEFRRRIRVAAGAMQSIKHGQWPPIKRPVELWQYFSHKVLRWLGPLWLGLVFVANCFLFNKGQVFQISLYSQISIYCIASIAILWSRFRRTRIGSILSYVMVSHIAMGIGSVRGLFWRQKGTWMRTERTTVVSAAVNRELQLTRDAQ